MMPQRLSPSAASSTYQHHDDALSSAAWRQRRDLVGRLTKPHNSALFIVNGAWERAAWGLGLHLTPSTDGVRRGAREEDERGRAVARGQIEHRGISF
jgi:hypothetical protein